MSLGNTIKKIKHLRYLPNHIKHFVRFFILSCIFYFLEQIKEHVTERKKGSKSLILPLTSGFPISILVVGEHCSPPLGWAPDVGDSRNN